MAWPGVSEVTSAAPWMATQNHSQCPSPPRLRSQEGLTYNPFANFPNHTYTLTTHTYT